MGCGASPSVNPIQRTRLPHPEGSTMARDIRHSVSWDFGPLKKFEAQIRADLRRSGNGPVRRAIRQWGHRYLAFTRERYVRNSRGGGEWKPLAESTKRRRRSGRGSGSPAILRDTRHAVWGVVPRGTRESVQRPRQRRGGRLRARTSPGGQGHDRRHRAVPRSGARSPAAADLRRAGLSYGRGDDVGPLAGAENHHGQKTKKRGDRWPFDSQKGQSRSRWTTRGSRQGSSRL